MTVLLTENGKPFTANGFGNKMREWCDQAELPDCTSHGLRKAQVRRLAEAGKSNAEIKAVTGHTTDSEVTRYKAAAVRSTVTAKQEGEFLGLPGGGESVAFQTIDIHRLGADGKIAQSWHVEDWLTFLLMRGALPIGR